MTATRCAYQQQDCPLTLAEGLEEYYRSNRGRVTRPGDLSPESRDLFRSHDMCHVIFGLDTTLADETMADMRTLISCNVGLRASARYLTTNPDAKALFEELGYGRAILATLAAVPRILRAVVENFRLTERWPWKPPASYLARPLSDLRRVHGIRVI